MGVDVDDIEEEMVDIDEEELNRMFRHNEPQTQSNPEDNPEGGNKRKAGEV